MKEKIKEKLEDVEVVSQVFLNNGKNGGMTLIALVVTIIILLILAGILISMLTGQNRNLKTSRRS